MGTPGGVFLQVLLKVGGLTLRNLGKLGVVAAEAVRCQFGVMRSGQRAWHVERRRSSGPVGGRGGIGAEAHSNGSVGVL